MRADQTFLQLRALFLGDGSGGERDYKIVQGLMMEIPDNRKDRVELLKVIG